MMVTPWKESWLGFKWGMTFVIQTWPHWLRRDLGHSDLTVMTVIGLCTTSATSTRPLWLWRLLHHTDVDLRVIWMCNLNIISGNKARTLYHWKHMASGSQTLTSGLSDSDGVKCKCKCPNLNNNLTLFELFQMNLIPKLSRLFND